MMKKIVSVVGARPNFIKLAPIHKVISNFYSTSSDHTIEHTIIHTGIFEDGKTSSIIANFILPLRSGIQT
jgi:UDP-N-acetylglucosamine 2-epimerase